MNRLVADDVNIYLYLSGPCRAILQYGDRVVVAGVALFGQ